MAAPERRCAGTGQPRFHDLWSLRQRLVLEHHETLGRVATMVGHGGYVLCGLEYAVSDIVWLRIFAIGGCGMVCGFQLLQPRVQWVTVFWCGLYVAVNVVMLWRLRGDKPAALSWEEARLHARFDRHLDAGQFSALMSLGEWLWLVDGALLAVEGCSTPDGRVFLIASGTCEATASGHRMADLSAGSVVGETAVLSSDSLAATATVAARGPVRCFVAPVGRVREAMEQRPELRAALRRLFAGCLAGRLRAEAEGASQRRYRAVLELACAADARQAARLVEETERLRRRLGVPGAAHAELLEEIPRCAHRAALRLPFEELAAPLEELGADAAE